ncbi:MAG: transcriptional regulator, DeoR family [Firmicutes bacterium]|nr:transcriptional regulator, DeoR family [Bacillota bacterium]
MFQVERQEKIVQILEEKPRVTVDELAILLGVTAMTIRRDLKYLESVQIISRTYGGAVLKSKLTLELPHKEKESQNKLEKERIAIAAADLVKDGQTVLLDAGTTTMEIAKQLIKRQNLTVVTSDVLIAAYLAVSSNFAIFCTGDRVQNITGACMGSRAIQLLKQIYADIAFIGASSVDVELGLSAPTFEKAELKKEMVLSADQVILVADNSKFNRRSINKICSLSEFALIICDQGLDEDVREKLHKLKINLQLV